MHGMYLASYQVDHHGALWFAVTVRLNFVFTERKVVCIVNVRFTSVPFLSTALAATKGPECVTILFVHEP